MTHINDRHKSKAFEVSGGILMMPVFDVRNGTQVARFIFRRQAESVGDPLEIHPESNHDYEQVNQRLPKVWKM